MNQTTFSFGLTATSQDQLEELAEKLAKIAGVISVVTQITSGLPEILVTVEFENSEAAKSIYRKLMTVFIKCRGIQLRHARSRLSEIFP